MDKAISEALLDALVNETVTVVRMIDAYQLTKKGKKTAMKQFREDALNLCIEMIIEQGEEKGEEVTEDNIDFILASFGLSNG